MSTMSVHKSPQLPELLTVAEVRSMLRVGRSTLYRLVAAGEIPALRIGRSLRFDREAVLTALKREGAA